MRRANYSAVAITLHWAIALALLILIPLGWWMGEAVADKSQAARAVLGYQLHKSLGLTVLLLTVLRLAWRIFNPPPPLPTSSPRWERLAAHGVHWTFYLLLVAMPLSGWAYVSTQWSLASDQPLQVPTLWFGLFEVPHLAGLEHGTTALRRTLAAATMEVHEVLAWGTVGLFVLHVGAALKHHLFDRDDILARMIPVLGRRNDAERGSAEEPSRAGLRIGMLVIVSTALAMGYLLFRPVPDAASAAGAPPTDESGKLVLLTDLAEVPASGAPGWIIAPDASAIEFSGVHAGSPFRGRFSRWGAEIRFDPDNPGKSAVVVSIDSASASDGNPLHDSSLPQGEWFDVKAHPRIVFRSSNFSKQAEGKFTMQGTVTIKGKALPLTMPFRLTMRNGRAEMLGRLAVDRTDADLGQVSDRDAEWVSQSIDLDIKVSATRADPQ